MSVPPFLIKTFDLVSEEATDSIVSWSEVGDSFIVWNNPEFSKVVLPKHFKHNNFSSFVRQLNTYGFKKIDPDRWEFSNPNFQRDRLDLLKGIHRRKGQTGPTASSALISSGQPAIEVGQFGGLAEEVESLKRDKNVLMMELVHLRQRQHDSDKNMSGLKHRLEHTERRLSQLITFFSNVASNPSVLAQMVTTAQASQAFIANSENGRKKRRHEDGANNGDIPPEKKQQQLIAYKPVDIASFFQQLLVSPMPEDEEGVNGTHDLEAHFNNINLRQGGGGASGAPDGLGGITIQEHSSPRKNGGAFKSGEMDAEISIPEDITAGMPSIGVSGLPFRDVAEGPEGPGTYVFDAGGQHASFLPQAMSVGASAGAPAQGGGLKSRAEVVPPPPERSSVSLSLDNIEGFPGDMLDAEELQDILKEGGSLDYAPPDDETWQALLDDMSSGVPPRDL